MIIHAAANSSLGTSPETYAVALYARGEQELLRLERQLCFDQVPHCAYRDPELMAIGINPLPRYIVRRYTKTFTLIGDET